MHSKEAHTAEHVFMGSLQKLVHDIFVKKVEHKDSLNKVYLKCAELSLDTIREAELMVNNIIGEGRKVKEHIFQSVEHARKTFPQMRAYEERISGDVRVIEIENYDYTACSREHTRNTAECGLLLVTHVSREQDEYEIEFVVGEQAKRSAVEMSMMCLKVTKELGASTITLERTARNLKDELYMYKRRLFQITEQLVDKIVPQKKGSYLVYTSIFDMLDDTALIKKAGEIVRKPNTIVVFINISDNGTILLACHEELQINCNSLLKSILTRFDSKGGGNPNFAVCSVPKDRVREIHTTLLKELNLE